MASNAFHEPQKTHFQDFHPFPELSMASKDFPGPPMASKAPTQTNKTEEIMKTKKQHMILSALLNYTNAAPSAHRKPRENLLTNKETMPKLSNIGLGIFLQPFLVASIL